MIVSYINNDVKRKTLVVDGRIKQVTDNRKKFILDLIRIVLHFNFSI